MALDWFWEAGFLEEGQRRLGDALSPVGDGALRATALHRLGRLEALAGRLAPAREYLAASLALHDRKVRDQAAAHRSAAVTELEAVRAAGATSLYWAVVLTAVFVTRPALAPLIMAGYGLGLVANLALGALSLRRTGLFSQAGSPTVLFLRPARLASAAVLALWGGAMAWTALS